MPFGGAQFFRPVLRWLLLGAVQCAHWRVGARRCSASAICATLNLSFALVRWPHPRGIPPASEALEDTGKFSRVLGLKTLNGIRRSQATVSPLFMRMYVSVCFGLNPLNSNETVLRDVLIALAKTAESNFRAISLLLTEVSSLRQPVNGVRGRRKTRYCRGLQLSPFPGPLL